MSGATIVTLAGRAIATRARDRQNVRGDSRRRSTGQLAMNQATRPPIECLAVDAPDEREPVAEFAALRSTHGGSSNHSVEGPHNNNHCERSDKPITHCYFLWRGKSAAQFR